MAMMLRSVLSLLADVIVKMVTRSWKKIGVRGLHALVCPTR